MHDILANKISTIERCVKRIDQEYKHDQNNLMNLNKQDSIVMNLQRAYEATINLSVHIISERKLDIPKSRMDVFNLLHKNGLIDKELSLSLQHIGKFLNTSLKKNTVEDINILQSILSKHVDDFKIFTKVILKIDQN